jgi:hypothetical protein
LWQAILKNRHFWGSLRDSRITPWNHEPGAQTCLSALAGLENHDGSTPVHGELNAVGKLGLFRAQDSIKLAEIANANGAMIP